MIERLGNVIYGLGVILALIGIVLAVFGFFSRISTPGASDYFIFLIAGSIFAAISFGIGWAARYILSGRT